MTIAIMHGIYSNIFAQKEILKDKDLPRTISSFWFPYPQGGRDERFLEPLRVLLRRFNDSYGESDSRILLGEILSTPTILPTLPIVPSGSTVVTVPTLQTDQTVPALLVPTCPTVTTDPTAPTFVSVPTVTIAPTVSTLQTVVTGVTVTSDTAVCLVQTGSTVMTTAVPDKTVLKVPKFSKFQGIKKGEGSEPEMILEWELVERLYEGDNVSLNRINQVLYIISELGFSECAQRAYALYSVLKNEEFLKKFWETTHPHKIDPRVLMVAMEYRNLMNLNNSVNDKKLTPTEINEIATAEKILERKESEEYYTRWFETLGITEESYQKMKIKLT